MSRPYSHAETPEQRAAILRNAREGRAILDRVEASGAIWRIWHDTDAARDNRCTCGCCESLKAGQIDDAMNKSRGRPLASYVAAMLPPGKEVR